MGDVIHQAVLSGKLITSIPRGASQWFFDAMQLNQSYDAGRKAEHQFYRRSTNAASAKGGSSLTREENALVIAEAPAMFEAAIGQKYPQFSHFVTNANGFKCFFYNHPGDGKPGSFCEGNRDRIVIVGTGHSLGDGVVMFGTPNAIIGKILAKQTKSEITAPVDGEDRRPLIEIALLHTFLMILGPEGCGKSTEMMRHVEEMVHEAEDAGAIFFSSPSIRQAAKKAEEYRRLHPDSLYVPYLYLSVTALYEKYCPEAERISRIDVLNQGLTSWLQEVWQEQPHIYAKMWEDRNQLFELRQDGKIPILFGCHETVRQHAAGASLTRIFYAPSFNERYWELPGPERRALRSRCRMENLIFRVIFDEVSDADLVTKHPADLVLWVRNCCLAIGWGDEDQRLTDSFGKFNEYLAAQPIAGMTWDMFLEIVMRDYGEADGVLVSDVEVMFDDRRSMYHAEVGSAYYAKTHSWWNDYPRITMLTTELVPAEIIRAIDRQAAEAGEQQDDRFVIHMVPTPASRDAVAVHVDRRCHKRGLPGLSILYRQRYPGIEIISDMLDKQVPEKITTHLSARGSNEFIGKDVAAFYTAISAKQFAELAVLNSMFDTHDMVRLFYVDRFNQTCGRNRGYRSGDNRPKHIAVMSDRLLRWVKPALVQHARYELCRELALP